MANHTGSEGVCKVGSDTILEIKDWTISENCEPIEDTTMGDSARSYKPGLITGSGSFTAYWDEEDTTGQGALTSASEVTLNVYPEGDAAGATYASFSAIITEESKTASFDGMVEATYGFAINGVVTWGTAV